MPIFVCDLQRKLRESWIGNCPIEQLNSSLSCYDIYPSIQLFPNVFPFSLLFDVIQINTIKLSDLHYKLQFDIIYF